MFVFGHLTEQYLNGKLFQIIRWRPKQLVAEIENAKSSLFRIGFLKQKDYHPLWNKTDFCKKNFEICSSFKCPPNVLNLKAFLN